ncbi:MAG: alpha-1,2-fucosyltransferase [Bacteroidales bacterium]|nr:alpha-1,2-fucosyltransferase [Bacteroidales bacterium]
MNILHFRGGLGNQLFEYAFYFYWKRKGVDKVFLDATYPSMIRKYGFDLASIFPEVGKEKHFLSYWKARPFFLVGDLLKKLFGVRLTVFEPQQLPVEGKVWIRGFFQYFDYLEEIRDDVRSLYTFREITEPENIVVAKRIEASESVSIHIRRGNYAKPRQRIIYGDICTLAYYREAIRQVKMRVQNPKFFIFSNDVEWVKRELALPDAEYVTWNCGRNSFRDMQLMSLCKYNIIANSSFSWWGAWLNSHKDKLVFAPAKWHHDHPEDHTERLLPPSWIRIGNIQPFVTLCFSDELTDAELSWFMRQQYGDFELCFPNASQRNDKRMTESPTAIHLLKIEKSEIKRFRNKRYLQKRLFRYFSTMN